MELPEGKRFEFKDSLGVETADADEGTISGYAARYGNVDRDGDVFEPKAFGGSLNDYMASAPICWMHDYKTEPIGRTLEIDERDEGLWVVGKLASPGISAKADLARGLLKDGVLRGLSVGFVTHEFDPMDPRNPYRGRRIKRASLVEWSPVSVASNPRAVVMAYKSLSPDQQGLAESRGETEFADLPVDDGAKRFSWSAATAREILGDDDWARYRKAHFWMDMSRRESKAGYTLPFATLVDGELMASLQGVKAAMAALLGARGGVDLPDAERRGVYDHIARYYRKAGIEPPEFHAAGEAFTWEWFAHDEKRAYEEARFADDLLRINGTIRGALEFRAARLKDGWDPLAGLEEAAEQAKAMIGDLLGQCQGGGNAGKGAGAPRDAEALLQSEGFDGVQDFLARYAVARLDRAS